MRGTDSSKSAPVRTEVQPDVWLDSRLALWVATERLLVVADLHWSYAASHRARGNLLPEWGDDVIEARLRSLLADYQPAEMLWLGDVVHTAEGRAGAEKFRRETVTPITLVAGNHDRHWNAPQESTVTRGRYFFHHGDREQFVPADAIEVIGHHHPAASWNDGAGSYVKVPAMVVSPRRFVLPAFSPWAAGTAWYLDQRAGELLWAIAPNRIFALPSPANLSVALGR